MDKATTVILSDANDSTSENTSRQIVDWLSQPQVYPEKTKKVELIETHISWIFLTDRYAYKLKKPVRYDFLDFSSLAARCRACRDEYRLNRRLAPDVYLDVLPINRTGGGRLLMNQRGETVDWVVKMRRLPKKRNLDQLIRNQKLQQHEIDKLKTTLASFYQQLPPATIRTETYLQGILQHVCSNRQELLSSAHAFSPEVIKQVHTAQLRVLQITPELLGTRVCDGRIVEGHGDLRPEHVYFAPDPVIIDCIEFNSELRRLDVVDELSFLAMETDALGAKEIGEQIFQAYFDTSGDRASTPLIDFFKTYRACVRAKVLALRSDQLTTSAHQAMLIQAENYLNLAQGYAQQLGSPLALVVRGLMGTGKSSLAQAISQRLGAELLQTDEIRRELFGQGNPNADYGEDQYRPENRRRVYQEMFRRAEQSLSKGLSVVLDGTFLSARGRSEAVSMAQKQNALPLVINCRCNSEIALQRMVDRMAGGKSSSQARPNLFHRQLQEEETVTPDTPGFDLDTSTSINSLVKKVFTRLRPLQPS